MRFLTVVLVVAAVVLVSVPAAAQSVPRTAWGAPDLQGVWDFRTLTPMERPEDLVQKDVYTEEEAADFEARRLAEFAAMDEEEPADIVGNYNQFWFDRGTTVVETNRTSLVTDPADGRIPPLTAAAEAQRAALAKAREGTGRHVPTPGGFVEDLGSNGLQLRCIMGFNSGPPMTPSAYNNNMQVFQTEDHVVLLTEMVHDARVVPLDGRPHLPADLRQWSGSSRARWDGDTLVVETTNFLRETGFMRGGSTRDLHLTERLTRVAPDTLLYEVTVNDPSTWTRPWSFSVPMQRNPDEMYEYACHEGNYGLYNILAGAR
ncbi:MAG: hypothetical protein OXF27_09120 [Acidobacteria bacterium]|nr:hypothetical protein [Acidobacteriota bacterium]